MAVAKEIKETIAVTIDEVFKKMNSISWLERQKAMKDEAFKNTEKILYCFNILKEHVADEEGYLAMIQKSTSGSIVRYQKNKVDKQSARSLNDATIDFQLEVKAHNVEYDKKNKLLTRSMNDAILSEPNSFGEIKIDKMLQKVRIDPCDAIIDAHKLAMGVEVEEITTDQSIEAYLKMFEKAGVKED